jgi:hypothetical protein
MEAARAHEPSLRAGRVVSGPATVRVGGNAYVCSECKLDSGAVTFTGRLRIRDLIGERLYPSRTITVPIGRVERVEWVNGRVSRHAGAPAVRLAA